ADVAVLSLARRTEVRGARSGNVAWRWPFRRARPAACGRGGVAGPCAARASGARALRLRRQRGPPRDGPVEPPPGVPAPGHHAGTVDTGGLAVGGATARVASGGEPLGRAA